MYFLTIYYEEKKKKIKVCIVLVIKLIAYKAGALLCIGGEMQFHTAILLSECPYSLGTVAISSL